LVFIQYKVEIINAIFQVLFALVFEVRGISSVHEHV